ncbi:unnamed protein product, partial [Phaeothamnion confervicola]
MATLADAFLDDLDELGESSDEEKEQGAPLKDADGDAEMDEVLETDEGDNGIASAMDVAPPVIRKVGGSGLLRSERYERHMAAIAAGTEETTASSSPTASDARLPGGDLILASNQLIRDIDEEMRAVHRHVAETYHPKFPELESLVPQPLDYVRTVRSIGNETDMTQVDLDSVLPQTIVMVVSVTGSTT